MNVSAPAQFFPLLLGGKAVILRNPLAWRDNGKVCVQSEPQKGKEPVRPPVLWRDLLAEFSYPGLQNRFSAHFLASNDWVAGQKRLSGLVRPRSQFLRVPKLTPRLVATAFWVSLACKRCCISNLQIGLPLTAKVGESTLTVLSNKWQKGRVTASFRGFGWAAESKKTESQDRTSDESARLFSFVFRNLKRLPVCQSDREQTLVRL